MIAHGAVARVVGVSVPLIQADVIGVKFVTQLRTTLAQLSRGGVAAAPSGAVGMGRG